MYTRHDCDDHDCTTTALHHEYRNDDDDSRTAADGGGSAVRIEIDQYLCDAHSDYAHGIVTASGYCALCTITVRAAQLLSVFET